MDKLNKKPEDEPRKPFKKPEFKKHTPISTVSGSGCNNYASRSIGDDTYYW